MFLGKDICVEVEEGGEKRLVQGIFTRRLHCLFIGAMVHD